MPFDLRQFDLQQELDFSVRTLSVERLIGMGAPALQERLQVVAAEHAELTSVVEALTAALDRFVHGVEFLQKEQERIELAQKLVDGTMVRVLCPDCAGTGLKAADATAGRLDVPLGSAFESVGVPASARKKPEVPEHRKCRRCSGKRWVVMPRYRD